MSPEPARRQFSTRKIVWILGITALLAVALVLGLLHLRSSSSDSSSPPRYKTITCEQWRALVNGSDLTQGLNLALSYLSATNEVDPKGADDVANFGDTISGVCGPTRLNDTTIWSHRDQVVSVFLSLYPQDSQ